MVVMLKNVIEEHQSYPMNYSLFHKTPPVYHNIPFYKIDSPAAREGLTITRYD